MFYLCVFLSTLYWQCIAEHAQDAVLDAVKDLVHALAAAHMAGIGEQVERELGRFLKTGRDRTAELIAQAFRMVAEDNRVRVWSPVNQPGIRLLYDCEAAAPMLEAPCQGTEAFSALLSNP